MTPFCSVLLGLILSLRPCTLKSSGSCCVSAAGAVLRPCSSSGKRPKTGAKPEEMRFAAFEELGAVSLKLASNGKNGGGICRLGSSDEYVGTRERWLCEEELVDGESVARGNGGYEPDNSFCF